MKRPPNGGASSPQPSGEPSRQFELTRLLADTGVLEEALAQNVLGTPPGPATLTRTARRREDFLSLTFEFRNLKLNNSKPRQLVKQVADQPAYLVVVFPPQHLSDETSDKTKPKNDLQPPGSVRARLAAPSRLVFEVPASILPLAFNLETLLAWVPMPQRVVPLAQPSAQTPKLEAPASHQTAIELPWFLLLSPRPDAGWAHEKKPVTHGNRTELWHTRLGTRIPLHFNSQGQLVPPRVDEADDAKRTVQAIWARDPGFPAKPPSPPDPPPPPGSPVLSLTADERWELVGLTSLVPGRRPVQVDRLMLSALGGWLDSRGTWDPPGGYSIEEWRHRATMGRDSYVRIVKQGYLLPFGHQAAKIIIIERRFDTVDGNPRAAYLVPREFVVVRQPVKEYGIEKAPGQPADGRGFPFRSVRITTLTTPDLEPNGASIHFPKTEAGMKDNVLFELIGVDWEGQPTEFAAPLMWVQGNAVYEDPNEPGPKPLAPATVASKYNSAGKELRARPAHGQKVAFAPANDAGDTSFSVAELVFRVQEVLAGTQEELDEKLNELQALQQAPFYPLLEEAKIRLSAVGETAGALLDDLIRVKIDAGFIKNGFHALENAGEVFLEILKGAVPKVAFGEADKSGGIATPDLSIAGLSRALGPVGGALEQLRKGEFDPKAFFDPAAKLLGSLRLGDVIKFVKGPHGLGQNGPKIQNIIVPKPPALPEKVITKLDWKPALEKLGDPLKIFVADNTSSLTINAEATTDLQDHDASTFKVEGLLRNIELHLLGKVNPFIVIEVKQVKFTAGKDKKPDLDVELGEISFDGPLAFVEEFRNFLSSLGKGFGVDVSPTGIEASLSLPLPTIAVGVFSLQNISIGLGAIMPFNGDAARFRFGFSSRENPFQLTVAMFGGGGFFALECGTDKSIMLEIALEFGAAVAFDIGVASGGVEVMAGIYIKVENDDALLSGFLRMGGELSILGIVSISCELYLGFEYYPQQDKCIGTAKFYLEIEVLFFTISVKAEVERRFGGESDPTFAQLMSPPDWTEYCNAYAPLGTP